MRKCRSFAPFAMLVVLAVVLAACGSSGSKSSKSSTTSPGGTTPPPAGGTAPQTTGFAQGVTNSTVKVGFLMVNFNDPVISANIDFTRGDQQKIIQSFVDDINNTGGIAGGKKIVPVYYPYAPYGNVGPPLQACTKLTEDDHVFAVIGLLYEPTGAAHACVTKQHQTVLITHELDGNIMKKATPGLLLTSDTLAERSTVEMLDAAHAKGLLDGKKFAIIAQSGTKNRIDGVIKPEMQKLGVDVAEGDVLQDNGSGDTTAAQAQLDSLIERWKGEGVNAVFISGLDAVSKQFVDKIKKALPTALLMTDADSSAQGAGQDAKNAGENPNPYQGMLAWVGQSDVDQFNSPAVQNCVHIWEQASGTKVVSPAVLTKGANGKRDQVWITVRDYCGDLTMLKDIADRVGTNLNTHNWIDTVNHFGTIQLVDQPQASLHEGKYDAGDSARLVAFDQNVGQSGDWAPVP